MSFSKASGGDDGVPGDGGRGDGASHGAPRCQRAGVLRALPGYVTSTHLPSKVVLHRLKPSVFVFCLYDVDLCLLSGLCVACMGH